MRGSREGGGRREASQDSGLSQRGGHIDRATCIERRKDRQTKPAAVAGRKLRIENSNVMQNCSDTREREIGRH